MVGNPYHPEGKRPLGGGRERFTDTLDQHPSLRGGRKMFQRDTPICMSHAKMVFSVLVFMSAISLHAQCGIERWPVKVTSDADASAVSRLVFPTTIASLRSIPPPRPLPQANRVAPTEETIYSVTATLIAFKAEDDSDYHLVLSDEEGRTIIAEIPSPGCSGGGAFAQDIATARSVFESRLTASSQFRTVAIPVEVRGIGFFDFLHGQQGVAPNGIEIHPVTAISFAPLTVPKPPPIASRRRSVAPGAGPGRACTLPSVTLSLSKNSVCSGVAVTLSWQSSDPTASVSIDGVSSSLPSSGSTTVGSTSAIAYSARAANACGSSEEAVTVLSIAPGAAASISGPSSVQQFGSATLSVSVANASGWSLSSANGNPIFPSSGSNTGAFTVQYTASVSGSDVVSVSAANTSCGSIQRTTSITVNTQQPQPQPQPQPGGSLRCCDGTLSPTCNNCASKQGCCSHHGGVCGC
jgi:hypothetical protein